MKGEGNKRFKGRLGASFLLFVLGLLISAPFLLIAPKPAQAFPTEDIITETQTTVVNVWNTLKDNLVEGAVSALVNGANYFLSKLAYEAAVALTSDCPGQVVCWDSKGFKEGLEDAWQGAVGEMVGTLSEEGGFSELGLNLCEPPNPEISMTIQLGLLNEVQPPEPSCDFNAIADNWTEFGETLTSEETLRGMLPAFEPGQGSLSVSLEVLGFSIDESSRASEQAAMKKIAESGSGGFSDIIDPVSGRILSPGAVTQKGFEKMETEKDEAPREAQQQMSAGQIAKGAVLSVVINTVQTFVQTFVSRLFNKFTSGILTAEEAITAQPDIILSEEGLFRPPGKSTAREALTRLLVSPPKDVGVIDPLLNFGVCPPAGRGPDNCVADAQLINAVRVAGATPYTVRTALEEGYLHGDWPLISSDDAGRDQDPFCYTYAYCESNLKKLRAARVIPIGWEIAAHDAPVGSANVRLQDVIDGFNDCNDAGERDEDHPFCRLIDPDWVLKAPPAQCRAQAYGPHLVSPEIPQRQEQCVDVRTCLAQDDMGNCVGGWGYCVREKNVWRFNGDACPEYYNSCMTLNPVKGGSPVNYLMNTIDYGVCNSDNVGCQQYATTLNVASCVSTVACADAAGCERSCTIAAEGDNDCTTGTTTCTMANACSNPPCDIGCKILEGQTFCSTLTGLESEKSDDWLPLPARFFSDKVETCNAKDNGCTALIAFGNGQSLNFVENGGFENVSGGLPVGWLAPTAAPASGQNGYIIDDADLAIEGSRAATLAGSATGRLVYGPLPARPGSMHTVSAALKQNPASGTNVSLTAVITLYDESGLVLDPRPFSTTNAFSEYLSAYDTTAGGSNACSRNGNSIRCVITYDDDLYDELRAGFSFLTTNPDVAQAAVEFYGAGAYLDAVQFEEGPLTPYHTGYNAGQRVNVKLAPDYLECTGEEGDRAECASFALMCRETEVGCERYTPTNGDPSVPGIVGTQDYCPAECNGYDIFFQEETDFEAAAADPEYFIPSTATQCSSYDAGCTSFTNVETEAIETYSHLRLCLHQDGDNVETFYTWEGSDTTGYQLRAWSLQSTELTTAPGPHDVCETPGCADTGLAPCVRLVDGNPDVCVDNPVAAEDRTGFCSAADIDAGDFDCREFYDSSGNRHYRRLSKTIISSPDCRFYRLSGRTVGDCNKGNGVFDATLGECIYRASPSWSDACPAAAAGCRAYRGNAAMNVQTILVEDFEGSFDWRQGSHDDANVEEPSNESLVVGGQTLHIEGSGGEDLHSWGYVDLSGAADADYTLSFWARGSGNMRILIGGLGYACLEDCTGSGTSCPCTDTRGNTCDVPAGGEWCFSTTAASLESGTAVFADEDADTEAPLVSLTPEWKLYELGPVRIAVDTLGSTILSMHADNPGEAYVDNVVVKRVRDNIYVVRDSWSTPSSCDRTFDGVYSPYEMLGCREYTDSSRSLVYLRSISELCRDKAVGCDAYSNTQNTSDTTGYRTYGAVCELAADCATGPNCPCDYQPPAIAGVAPPPIESACRVAIGESECRFTYDGIDAPDDLADAQAHPDRFTVSADERLYIVAASNMQCPATSVGCRTMGVPEVQFERKCEMPDLDADGKPDKCAVVGGSCTCFDSILPGESCAIPEGETKCVIPLDEGVIGAWRAIAFKDDPSKYDRTLCETEAVGCEAYSGAGGTFYFKDPGNQVCEFKTNVKYGGVQVSGWFRKSQLGGIFPCYEGYLIGGETYGILKNGDVGYGGWVGLCAAEYNRCEEFVDPLDTSAANPEGKPYYYLNNSKLDKSGCEGQVSLKQGCVLVNQTSNTQAYFSSAASYFRSDFERGGDLITPLDCDPNDPRRSSLCDMRCYRKASGTCDGTGLQCTQNSDCGLHCANEPTRTCTVGADCGVGPTAQCVSSRCLGSDVWGMGCTEDWQCDRAAGEECIDPATMAGIDEDEVTGNDANLVLKVRRDRECAEWLECDSVVPTYDSDQGRWINRCANFGLCTENKQVGESYVCSEFVQEPRELLTVDDYVARDTTWRGLDYSGYSLVGRYPAQYLQSFQISSNGVCVGGSDAGEECSADDECNSMYCSKAEFDTTKFGIRLTLCQSGPREGEYCDDDLDCGASGSGDTCATSCEDDNDCPSDGYGEPGSNGTCLRGVCVYDFRGGPLQAGSSLSGPSCRAYPEKDAPYPADVLNTQGDSSTGYDDFGNAMQKKTAFRGAYVCQEGNNCECSYRRVGYGTGQSTVRFHSLDSSVRYSLEGDGFEDGYADGVCVGGNNAGTPCDPGSPGDTCGEPDQGGSCTAVGSVTNALGWPGFCVDTDTSRTLYGNRNMPGCNLWLPVDIIPGMTDMFGQSPEAGFGAGLSTAQMCTVASGNAGRGVCSEASLTECEPSAGLACPSGSGYCNPYAKRLQEDEGSVGDHNDSPGSDWFHTYDPWYTWGGGDIDGDFRERVDTEFGDGSLYRNDISEIRIAIGDDPDNPIMIVLSAANDFKFAHHWGSPARGEPTVPDGTFEYDGVTYLSNEADPSQARNCINVLTYSGNKEAYFCEGHGCDADACLTLSSSISNCLVAAAEFDASGRYTGLYTSLCSNYRDDSADSDRNLHVRVLGAHLFARESCEAVSLVHDDDADVKNTAFTNRLYRLSQGIAVSGAPYLSGLENHYTLPSYIESVSNAGYDHTPIGAIAQPTNLDGTALSHPIPVIGARPDDTDNWENSAGSPYYSAPLVDDDVPEVVYPDIDRTLGYAVVAGFPFMCSGICRLPFDMEDSDISNYGEVVGGMLDTTIEQVALEKLSELFAVVFRTYGWRDTAGGGGAYDDPSMAVWDDYDRRAQHLSGSISPRVVPVSLANCIGAGDICQELSTGGMSVNGATADRCYAGGSAVNVQLQYYAYADSDHMPVRRKIVDFGDGTPPVIQDGSYKNHRGLDADGEEICGQTDDDGNIVDFGLTPDACDGRYYREQKTYTCSAAFADTLSPCSLGSPFYPCRDEVGCCVFRPRVQILDNWGVCNGSCPGEPGGNSCFNSGPLPDVNYLSATADPTNADNECYDLGPGGTTPDTRSYHDVNPGKSGIQQPWTAGPEITVCPGVCPGT